MNKRLPAIAALSLAISGALVPMALPLAAQAAEPVGFADLRADSNRDGLVDLTGDLDESVEDTASAIVLPNLDDDTNRCKEFRKRKLLPNAELVACNDASDKIVNGAKDALDLATVKTVPQAAIPGDAVGSLRLATGNKAGRMKVFISSAGRWRMVTPKTKITAAQLRTGLTLGVEATDIIRNRAVWDGSGSLTLTVTASGQQASDTIRLQTAPMLTTHHLMRTQQLLVTDPGKYQGAKPRIVFNQRLDKISKAAGVPLRQVKFDDPWAQDLFEPTYVSMPRAASAGGSASGTQSMRLLLRSDQNRVGNKFVYRLRGPGTGVVWQGKTGKDETLDSTGNVETIPPYAHNGKSFSQGRIIIGARPGEEQPSARMLRIFRSQGYQDPLLLDVSFLSVGHVDEFVQFIPADNEAGFRIAIADPRQALDLLRQAKAAGQGNARVVQHHTKRGKFGRPQTVNEVLGNGDRGVVKDNERAAKVIDKNLALLLAETGLTEADVVRVPVLFFAEYAEGQPGEPMPMPNQPKQAKQGGMKKVEQPVMQSTAKLPEPKPADSQKLSAREEMPQVTLSALVPDAVNNVVISPNELIVAKQFGVKVGGVDIFARAVTQAYAKVGMKVTYIDDLIPYSLGNGDVHCGTNTLRKVDDRLWWLRYPN